MPGATKEPQGRLLALLGDLPAKRGAVDAKTNSVENKGTYVLETLELDLNGLEPVPAYFVKPAAAEGPLPVVLFNHSHGGIYEIGKDEMLRETGKGYLHAPSYAEFLTGLGYAALSIDAWGFGERFTRSEGELFKEMLWKGQVMWGMMVFDSMRAIDYLASRPDVNAACIGTAGISMGGTMAWWLSALDERIAFCIDLCSTSEFADMIRDRVLDDHGVYHFVPGLLKQFTAADIGSLIAPRPRLSLSGRNDPLFPVAGVRRLGEAVQAEYARAGVPGNWQQVIDDCAHEETARMREQIRTFLQRMTSSG